MAIRALIFDCGGVLNGARGSSGLRRFRSDLESLHGLESGALKRTLKDAARALNIEDDDDPRVLDEAHARLERLAGRELPGLHDQWRAQRSAARGLLLENVALLRELAPSYRIAVLANSDGAIEERLVAWGLRDLVDVVYDSGVEGIEKPDRRAFEVTAARLGIAPGECIMIDNHEEHVEEARALGMTGIHFVVDRGDDLRAQLALVLGDDGARVAARPSRSAR